MGDVKLADIMQSGESGDVVVLGFPYDEGVARNGGRPGAHLGPEKFRAWLKRFGSLHNPEVETDLTSLKVSDAGDVPPGLSLEEAHTHLTGKVAAVLQAGGIPFVIGGGNDQSYPNARALIETRSGQQVGVINIDAHLDVRPLNSGQAHSGSPFRLLLEDSRFFADRFIEFAAQGSQCSREHANFVRQRNGRIIWLNEMQKMGPAASFDFVLEELGSRCDALFVSFDLDSVAAAHAPGVSCPGVLGLSARDAMKIAETAGRHPAVFLFDLSEYNPLIEEERTGRLAAGLFYHFCLGVAARKEGRP